MVSQMRKPPPTPSITSRSVFLVRYCWRNGGFLFLCPPIEEEINTVGWFLGDSINGFSPGACGRKSEPEGRMAGWVAEDAINEGRDCEWLLDFVGSKHLMEGGRKNLDSLSSWVVIFSGAFKAETKFSSLEPQVLNLCWAWPSKQAASVICKSCVRRQSQYLTRLCAQCPIGDV